MRTVFASDTHLSADRPRQNAEFAALLTQVGKWRADLYLLGDIVEFWPGDDDDATLHRDLVVQLADLAATGCRVRVMRGNRDFLLGERFAAETGVELLDDYATVELGGERVLLTHGDLLCTLDIKYQEFRRFVRNPANQQQFLSMPLAERRRIAAQTREGTQSSMAEKAADIMDVDDAEVLRVMRAHAATVLVHGHTHRPALHQVELDGAAGRRFVLGDWYEPDHARLLVCDDSGLTLRPLTEVLARP